MFAAATESAWTLAWSEWNIFFALCMAKLSSLSVYSCHQ